MNDQLGENLLGESAHEPPGFAGDLVERFELGSAAGGGSSDAGEGEEGHAAPSSWWFHFAQQLLQPKKGAAVLVAVCALAAPIGAYCLSVETSISFEM